jgi:hypothetical protein
VEVIVLVMLANRGLMHVGQIAPVLCAAELSHQIERITQQSAKVSQQLRQRSLPAFIFGQITQAGVNVIRREYDLPLDQCLDPLRLPPFSFLGRPTERRAQRYTRSQHLAQLKPHRCGQSIPSESIAPAIEVEVAQP